MNKVLDVLSNLEGHPKLVLAELFRNAPVWLLEACKVVKMDKNEVFIREKDKVNKVYILTKGVVKASDFRIFGIVYDFCQYDAIEILGGMEMFLDCDTYRTTLITKTPCEFIVLDIEVFRKWMLQDNNALWMHSKTVIRYLLEETRKERAFLFLQGIDRVYLLFEHLYEQNAVDGRCHVKLTRQQISDETGLSIKTINRALKQMMEENLVEIQGSKLTITESQFREMKELSAEKIDI
ncbi:MAG: family transcriptional regulator, cyclic receptor protein [Clostridiales bacterium]|nr:family transcriptional regulator, cyclic receptor protein [Clostridiales bacterium]